MTSPKTAPVVFLMGPTASGKSDLAMQLHEQLPLEIISVDSSQVYRGMDIGTAKPGALELSRAPHRLIDIRDPSIPYSAAEFVEDAREHITQVQASGRIPFLVGGTLFYFHVLEFGLPELPSADAVLRDQLLQEAERVGWQTMHQRLGQRDPQAAARIHPNDAQRIQRALEIVEITGQTVGEISRNSPVRGLIPPPIKLALVTDNRETLHQRIAQRFQTMLEQGLVEEVERLYQRQDLAPHLPAVRMVGYRQIWEYLEGKVDYTEMVAKGIAATRQLAKRQFTWIRGYPGVELFDCTDDRLLQKSLEFLKRKLSQFSVY